MGNALAIEPLLLDLPPNCSIGLLWTSHSSWGCTSISSAAVQVKLLKCLVDNIVVDISFETLGGLCTVAFLESIDRRIGSEHLFKRSIILVRSLAVQGHTECFVFA